MASPSFPSRCSAIVFLSLFLALATLQFQSMRNLGPAHVAERAAHVAERAVQEESGGPAESAAERAAEGTAERAALQGLREDVGDSGEGETEGGAGEGPIAEEGEEETGAEETGAEGKGSGEIGVAVGEAGEGAGSEGEAQEGAEAGAGEASVENNEGGTEGVTAREPQEAQEHAPDEGTGEDSNSPNLNQDPNRPADAAGSEPADPAVLSNQEAQTGAGMGDHAASSSSNDTATTLTALLTSASSQTLTPFETMTTYDVTGARAEPLPVKTDDTRVAVCLVGGARDFEVTGPSIMYRLLTAYPNTHVFVNSPLDEMAFKLHGLAWAPRNITVAAVRIFPNTWVDEEAYPPGILGDITSPQGNQGMFQYFRLVEGCIPLIQGYEREKGFRFHWIVRTRVDSFWKHPPPALQTFSPKWYTVPYGTNCLGINDRFGIGTWKTSYPGLSRLSLLRSLREKWPGLGNLNSEGSFQKQFEVTGTVVARGHLYFCVVSRRVYKGEMMPVASMASSAPLNGAKCRPCIPLLRGRKAESRLQKYSAAARLGPVTKGVDLCNAKEPWVAGWQDRFDRLAGPGLGRQRLRIMHSSFAECVARFEHLHLRTRVWDTPSPLTICLRRALGPSRRLGDQGASFETLVPDLQGDEQGRAVILILSSSSSGRGSSSSSSSSSLIGASAEGGGKEAAVLPMPLNSWLKMFTLFMTRRGRQVHVDSLTTSQAGAPQVADVAVLNVTLHDALSLFSGWVKGGTAPEICQLLVAVLPETRPPPQPKVVAGQADPRFVVWRTRRIKERKVVVSLLSRLHFQLSSCIREPGSAVERCTYFSSLYCKLRNPQ